MAKSNSTFHRLRPMSFRWKGWHTTARLEPEFWDALADVARREGITRSELASRIEADRDPDQPLSSAIRVFVMRYYRSAAEGR